MFDLTIITNLVTNFVNYKITKYHTKDSNVNKKCFYLIPFFKTPS